MAAKENLLTSVPLRIRALAPLFAIPPRPAEIQNEETKRKTIQEKLKEQITNLLLLSEKRFKGTVSRDGYFLKVYYILMKHSSFLFSAIDGLSPLFICHKMPELSVIDGFCNEFRIIGDSQSLL
jgi:hypothetical protein